MTKINIFPIIRDHLASLRDAHSKNASFFDYFIFYLVPFVIALGAYCTKFVIDRESYSASITFFGIFIALLLNIQMAMFGIYQRKWEVDDDEISAVVDEQKIETRRVLLGEINANVSYLIVVCCLALVVVLLSYIENAKGVLSAAATAFLYAHFLLTMLMVVKRAHALFQREYRGTDE